MVNSVKNLLLVIVIVLCVLGIFQELLRLKSLWQSPDQFIPPKLAFSSHRVDGSSTPHTHLFGVPEAEMTHVASMPLGTFFQLKGIMFDSVAANATALIAIEGYPEKNYRVGDRLPNGVLLSAIERDRVIVSKAGKLFGVALMRISP